MNKTFYSSVVMKNIIVKVNKPIFQNGCYLLRKEKRNQQQKQKTTAYLISKIEIIFISDLHRQSSQLFKRQEMASITRLSLTSSSALCRLLMNRNAGLIQQHLPSMIIPSATQQRSIVTSPVRRDIDSAAKYIGAGAATVGVAGAGAGQ